MTFTPLLFLFLLLLLKTSVRVVRLGHDRDRSGSIRTATTTLSPKLKYLGDDLNILQQNQAAMMISSQNAAMMISSQNAAMMISSQKAEEATPGGRGPATGPAGTPQRQPRPRRRTCQHAPECREPYPLASMSSMTAWSPQQSFLRPSPRERGRPAVVGCWPASGSHTCGRHLIREL